MSDNRILSVSKSVKWIGILDYDIRTFDIVMETKYGTTYNSYIIDANFPAIIETAKEKFWDEYEAKIREVIEPSKIRFIIVDHTEPDHSGSVRKLLNIAPNAQVVGSGNAIRYLKDQIGDNFPHIVVKDGDVIDLGDKKLRIIGAPNLHWPDSIYTYLEEENILFTCDSFGAHFCNNQMFDDKVGNFDDAFKYYFDVILKPFSKFMLKAIEKIRPLEINTICTGHGPILSSNWKYYVDLTQKWSEEYMLVPNKNKILVAYVSAYGYTKELAYKIAEGLQLVEGIEVELCDIEKLDAVTLSTKIEESNAYLLGSPTINQNMLPQLYSCFAHMSPLRDKGKLASAFGSYGWSGEGEKYLVSNIQNLKLDYFGQACFVKFRPQEKDFKSIISFGTAFAEKLLDKNNNETC
ncbi:MAG: FprA family A-type flavoprotein [Bacteroidota bacterium]